MASAYPGGLDSLSTSKANATATVTDHAAHHNDLADAVNKIEAELGTNPSAGYATVTARLLALQPAAPSAYTVTNGTTDRVLDANAASLNELADVVATLIADLQARGIVG
jgi:hypothetical protein